MLFASFRSEHKRNLGKTALHTGGLRFGTHCLMTVEQLIPLQLLK